MWQPSVQLASGVGLATEAAPEPNVALLLYPSGMIERRWLLSAAFPCTARPRNFPFDRVHLLPAPRQGSSRRRG